KRGPAIRSHLIPRSFRQTTQPQLRALRIPSLGQPERLIGTQAQRTVPPDFHTLAGDQIG
ncbi:MAG TPA: hypothetical protein VJL59_12120, partial [Anaerolineales bacterium]|nr:hypothetical protein [Anaerolineales bacterium]